MNPNNDGAEARELPSPKGNSVTVDGLGHSGSRWGRPRRGFKMLLCCSSNDSSRETVVITDSSSYGIEGCLSAVQNKKAVSRKTVDFDILVSFDAECHAASTTKRLCIG